MGVDHVKAHGTDAGTGEGGITVWDNVGPTRGRHPLHLCGTSLGKTGRRSEGTLVCPGRQQVTPSKDSWEAGPGVAALILNREQR